jgi:hypothetical protein
VGGQEGGTRNKIVPKTFVKCEEQFCQFSMELEDEISAKRVLQNHMFVAHKRQDQDHKQRLCGRKGGRRRGAKNKIVPDWWGRTKVFPDKPDARDKCQRD